MFERLGHIVIRFRFAFLLFWVGLALICYFFAPTLSEVGKSDETSFLPQQSESQEAEKLLDAAFPGDATAGEATLVFTRAGGLTGADREFIAALPAAIFGPGASEELAGVVTEVITAATRPELESWLTAKVGDRTVAEMAQVNLSVGGFENTAADAVTALRDLLARTKPPGLEAHVTGLAGIGTDYLGAAMAATDRTTVVTVVLVVIILLLIYRAPLAALAPLLTIGVAWVVARGVLGWLAQAGWQISSVLDTFMVVLVFGVGTDYSIFLISRVREQLAHDEWAAAARRAVGRIGGVITASAATVIVGLSAMAVARFGMVRSVGPALAVAIAVTVLAGLTLTPAYLGLFGRLLFWPFHRRLRVHDGRRGIWAGLARALIRHPGVVTVVLVVALAVPAGFMPTLQSDFNMLGELPAGSDGATGFRVITEYFNEGQTSPLTVVVQAPGRDLASPGSLALLRQTHDLLVGIEGVAAVRSLVSYGGDNATPEGFRPSRQLAAMAEQLAPQEGDPLEALRQLLEEDTEGNLAQVAAYVVGLGESFEGLPDLASYRSSLSDLQSAGAAVGLLRSALRVGTQLSYVAAQVEAAGPGDATQLPLLQAYLGELAAAFPEVEANPGFRDAEATLASMAEYGVTPQLTDRLVRSLQSLGSEFADRPEAYLISTLMASSDQGRALEEMLEEPLARLPGELASLSGEFATRPDFYLPGGDPGVDQLKGTYLSPDGTLTKLTVVLELDPFGNEAIRLIPAIRRALAAEEPSYGPEAQILTSGQTAAYADIRQTIREDFWRVAAITVAGILLVLVVLLRALVAPLYLVATVLLSWMTSLGIARWLFQDLLGHAGVNYFLPLIVFVLLVALGSDYNIFLMSRVREESDRFGVHDGIQVASARTGTVITSAGIILAGTFAAMAVAPLRLLLQIGVTVALGVLIDTFVVRSLLVPAITALIGRWAWWPFHKRRLRPQAAGEG